MQQSQWRKRARLSSGAAWLDRRIDGAGFDRAPWLAVGLGAGIAAWFVLPAAAWWVGWVGACALVVVAAWSNTLLAERFPYLRMTLLALPLALMTAPLGPDWQ